MVIEKENTSFSFLKIFEVTSYVSESYTMLFAKSSQGIDFMDVKSFEYLFISTSLRLFLELRNIGHSREVITSTPDIFWQIVMTNL